MIWKLSRTQESDQCLPSCLSTLKEAHYLSKCGAENTHQVFLPNSYKQLKQGWIIKYDIIIAIVENASFRTQGRELCCADIVTE